MTEAMFEQMTNHYVEQFKKELTLNTGNLDKIQTVLKDQLSNLFLSNDGHEQHSLAISKAHAGLTARFAEIEYMQETSVKSLHSHNWYAGPAEDAPIWNQLVDRLKHAGRSENEIADLDKQSTAILALAHPPGERLFRSQGVVVGHVQSGKTGNMSAVIAKAADTPYRFFLVLSGLTNALREQTQVRFDSDLGISDKTFWHPWTTEFDDFSASSTSAFQFDLKLRQLAVLKKNKFVLERFLKKLRATPKTTLQTMPFLVIDDECDQASVNSAAVADEMTRINALVREILDELPRVTYIGYTATPYANVLINPRNAAGEMADLYPKDFIYAMTPPKAYFGAERLFGQEALTGDAGDTESDSYDGLDMIRAIPENEAKILRPSQKMLATLDSYAITESLDHALKYWFMAVAARACRTDQADKHCSMLINTSHLVKVHFLIDDAVTKWLRSFRTQLQRRDKSLLKQLESIWNYEMGRVDSVQFGLEPVLFFQLFQHLESQLNEVEVIVENGYSEHRIDYSEQRKYIVIGGNVVSRGLTLEGLMVSFFLRTANQYDTLMQMGRWFGYRQGYEDLPRIWMEEPVRDSFRSLAMVEAEIRSEIAIYHEKQLTPEQFALRIRRLPGMLITARNKMHHAVIAEVSYAGRHLQTFRFKRNDQPWLQENWNAGSRLIDAVLKSTSAEQKAVKNNQVFYNIPVSTILDFYDSYHAHEKQEDMSSSLIRDYIRARLKQGDERYKSWNIAVMSPHKSPGYSASPLGSLGSVKTVLRSSLTQAPHETADIKALMSLRDLTIDFEHADSTQFTNWRAVRDHRDALQMPPLLLLYPIHRESVPSQNNDKRFPLNASMDVLGTGIWFPSAAGANDADFVSVDLPSVLHEDDDDFYVEMQNELTRSTDDDASSQHV